MTRLKRDIVELGGRVADALVSENSPTGVYAIALRFKQAERSYRRRSRNGN
jgi:hypothetical protein